MKTLFHWVSVHARAPSHAQAELVLFLFSPKWIRFTFVAPSLFSPPSLLRVIRRPCRPFPPQMLALGMLITGSINTICESSANVHDNPAGARKEDKLHIDLSPPPHAVAATTFFHTHSPHHPCARPFFPPPRPQRPRPPTRRGPPTAMASASSSTTPCE